jgi:hypothetical protein
MALICSQSNQIVDRRAAGSRCTGRQTLAFQRG